MSKLITRLLLCLMTALLILCGTSFCSTYARAEIPEQIQQTASTTTDGKVCSNASADAKLEQLINFEHVPKGWDAPTDGYFANTETGRMIREALTTRRLQRDSWHDAYIKLYQRSTDYASQVAEQTNIIENAAKNQRQHWWQKITTGVGIFAGVSQAGEPVVGVGIVCRIIKF